MKMQRLITEKLDFKNFEQSFFIMKSKDRAEHLSLVFCGLVYLQLFFHIMFI